MKNFEGSSFILILPAHSDALRSVCVACSYTFAPPSSSQLDPLGDYLVVSVKLVNLQQTQESFYSLTPLFLLLPRVCFFCRDTLLFTMS